MTRPIGIDLFCGAGGMSLGFEQAGFDIVAAVDVDPVHCAVHEFNFPQCKTVCASVADLSGDGLRDTAGLATDQEIDVVFGGAPCQGFSMMGKRTLDDPRNSLVKDFHRLVVQLKPKYFVFENVKGLTVGKHKKFLDELVECFESDDYAVLQPSQVLNAADFGVPQNRHRLFLIGARKDMQLPNYPTGIGGVTVGDALDDLPEVEGFPELLDVDEVIADLGSPSQYAMELREISNEASHFGYRRSYDPSLLTSSLRTVHTERSRERFSNTPHGETEPVSRFFKLSPSGKSNTLRAGTASDRGAFTSPRPIHPYTPRCITVREAARLHSYPDWFRFHVTKWHGFRQIGNSVPPKLARAVASELLQRLCGRANAPTDILELGDKSLLQMNMAQAADYFGVARDVIPQRTRKVA